MGERRVCSYASVPHGSLFFSGFPLVMDVGCLIKSASRQYRFSILCGERLRYKIFADGNSSPSRQKTIENQKGEASQLIVNVDSLNMDEGDSIHLATTLMPYFNAKMYSRSFDPRQLPLYCFRSVHIFPSLR